MMSSLIKNTCGFLGSLSLIDWFLLVMILWFIASFYIVGNDPIFQKNIYLMICGQMINILSLVSLLSAFSEKWNTNTLMYFTVNCLLFGWYSFFILPDIRNYNFTEALIYGAVDFAMIGFSIYIIIRWICNLRNSNNDKTSNNQHNDTDMMKT